MHCVNNEHGNRRVEDQIEDHAGLHCGNTIAKDQRHVVEKVLSVPADIQTYSDAERITNQEKCVG